jgi:GNAT superfamily N-acetyltransferase
MNVNIRRMQYSEIPLLKDFTPADWNSDLVSFFSFHYGYDYFYPIVSEFEKKINGCGCIIKNKTVGWLGNIIVLPEFRHQGIGEKLTSHLIDYLDNENYDVQLLIATKIGEPIYLKLGFKLNSNYLFYKTGNVGKLDLSKNIKEIKLKDYNLVKKLDREITGEDRQNLIEHYLSTGYKYTSKCSPDIEGFYLPNFGNGLIIAINNQAGLELLKLSLIQGHSKVIIPEANISAKNFLIENGFQEYSVCPRMVRGKNIQWKPECIYSRASGYCG